MSALVFDNNVNHMKAYFKQFYQAQHEVEIVFDEWLKKLCNVWLEEEFYLQSGAERYQRSSTRVDYGNGYYQRRLLTARGIMNVSVPRGKQRKYKYTLFDKYKRYSQQFGDIVTEALLLGHSTRDARRFFNNMFGQASISHALASKILRRFDQEIDSWRRKKIKKEVAVLVLDAIHLKGAITGLKRAKPVLFAYCAYKDGTEEIVDFEPRKHESTESWNRLCGRLHRRGLTEAKIIVRDDNRGIREAASLYWPQSVQQFCVFHLMQNFVKGLKRLDNKKKKRQIIDSARKVYQSETKEEFYSSLNQFISRYKQYRHHPAFKYLYSHSEDATQFYKVDKRFQAAAKTTNRLERTFKEIKRRVKAFGRFPNTRSCERWMYAFIKKGLLPQYGKIKSAQYS